VCCKLGSLIRGEFFPA
ncbi:hypothetical protein M8J77_019800, partial [Diaphorina citri]